MLIGHFTFDLTLVVTLIKYIILLIRYQLNIVVVHVLPPVVVQMLTTSIVTSLAPSNKVNLIHYDNIGMLLSYTVKIDL